MHYAARSEWLQNLGQNIAHRHSPTATKEKKNQRDSRRGHLELVIVRGWLQTSAAAGEQRAWLSSKDNAGVRFLLYSYFRWFRRPGVRWESAMWFHVRNDKRNPVPQAGYTQQGGFYRGLPLPARRGRLV